ncbi:MAG: redoxin domain-containing protein [Caldisericia bacterium]|nr:redoxin domain-containing protein [Caldisericia bacterium]
MGAKKTFLPIMAFLTVASLTFASVACNKESDQNKPLTEDANGEVLVVPDIGATPIPNIPVDPNGKSTIFPMIPDSQFEYCPSLLGEASSIWRYMENEKAEALIVTFWATWNLQSKKELVHLETLFRKYKQQGLRALAISIDPDNIFTKEKISEILNYDQGMEEAWQKLGIFSKVDGKYLSYPTALDSSRKTLETIGVSSIPCALLVTKNHKIYFRHYGFDEDKFRILEEKTDDLLKHMKQEFYPISGTNSYSSCMIN